MSDPHFEPRGILLFERGLKSIERVIPPLAEHAAAFHERVRGRFGSRPRSRGPRSAETAYAAIQRTRGDAQLLRWVLYEARPAQLAMAVLWSNLALNALVSPDDRVRHFVKVRLDKRMSGRSLILAGATLQKLGRM